jgi:methyl-accepting chemotaxis protein
MNARTLSNTGLTKLLCGATVIIIAGILCFVDAAFLTLGRIGSAIIIGILCSTSIVFTVLLYRLIARIAGVKSADLTNLANGDLKTEYKTNIDKSTETMNEISIIRKKVHQVILRIIAGNTTLDSTANELLIIANDTQIGSEKLGMESKSLAAASEQLTTNITSMASASEELSTTSRTVAAAIEELSVSINEVAKNSENGAKIGREVSTMAIEAEKILSIMGDGTSQITSVVDVIKKIADQTNLLALNATIEAARAGTAGKSFTVVAKEVKHLALQSLQASREISQQVRQVQQNTQKAIVTIQQVFATIGELSSVTNTIAAAVEEQSATTLEVAHSIMNVSSATDELARNIQESSFASEEVAKRTLVLEELARQTALVSSQTKIGVDSINDVRQGFENIIRSFQTDDKKFDIAKVKTAHMNWVKRLQSVLRGELVLKPEEVTTHTACDFGKWFFSDSGKMLASIPAYAEVNKYHEQVHVHAREVVRFYGNKQYEEAQKKMEDFETALNKLFSHLNELYFS